MRLYLLHGRHKPDDELQDWGFDGPKLEGVEGIHQTYGNPINVHFKTEADCKHARAITGWIELDRTTLTMLWDDDMVLIQPEFGEEAFFGDWGLMAE